MPSKFGGLPVDQATAPPPSSQFGGVVASAPKSKFGGVAVVHQSKFGGVPVSTATPELQTTANPPENVAQAPPRDLTGINDMTVPRDEAFQMGGNPMVQSQPMKNVAGGPDERKPLPTDDMLSATGKAIQNAVPHWQQQLGALTQMVGEKMSEIVNTVPPGTPGTDPALQRQEGEIAAKVSLRGQLDRLQAGEKVQPIDVAPGSLDYYVSSIAGSTLEMAPGMAAALLLKNPFPAMAMIGAQSGGNAYGQARDLGVSPQKARQYAALYAVAEGIPEALPIHMLLGHASGKVVDSIVKGALGEGASEMFTEGLQALIDKGYIKPDETWGDVWPRIRDAGIIGAGSGGLIGAAAPTLETAGAAVSQATSAARQVSAEVLGKGIAGLKSGGSTLAPEFAASLKGKDLNERVAAIKARQAEIAPAADASKVSTPPDESMTPAAVVKHFEGFTTSPYWDVNAYRTGYGSDTWTDADGKVHKVKPGDKITREDADRDIQRRLDTEFIPSAKAEVGAKAWDNLTPGAQAAVASVTYNYGNLPNDIAAAVRTGDAEAIATAIENHADDNSGVNAGRRKQEAALVRGEAVDMKAPVETQRSGSSPKAEKLSIDPETYTGPRTPAVMIGDELFTGKIHTDAVEKAIQQFGADSPQIKAFEANPESAIGMIAEADGKSASGVPYKKGFTANGISGDNGQGVRRVVAEAKIEAAKAPPARASRETTVTTPIGNARVKVKPTKAPERPTEADYQQAFETARTASKSDMTESLLQPEQRRQMEIAAVGGHGINLRGDAQTRADMRALFGGVGGDVSQLTDGQHRADIMVDAPKASISDFLGPRNKETSASVLDRVKRAKAFLENVETAEHFSRDTKTFISKVADKFSLDERAVSKIEKVARSIAALEKSEHVTTKHVAEAVVASGSDRQSRNAAEGGRGNGKANPQPEILSDRRPARESAPQVTAESLDSNTLNLTFNPGPKWVPNLTGQSVPRQQSVETSDGPLDIGDKPTMRDEPRKKLLNVIGERLYQGKIKGKVRAGFYRTSNSEIRVKHFDDIETQAHEAAHFLEFHHAFAKRFRVLRHGYRAELDPLSYTQDPKVLGEEGFAEYVRLWSTQYAKAKKAAPNFTRAFEAELRKAGLYKKMAAFQQAAHRWYYQGALAQFRGKSGESEHFPDQLATFMRQHPVERFLQGFVDPAYGAKVIERQIYGRIHSAEGSAYKLMRMSRGAESMHEAAIEDGALELQPDGSYGTTGKGLKAIFWPAAKHGAERFDQLMEYFKARRGEELMRQGRENLFTGEEIRAGLDLARQHPEFKQIFTDWLTFNDKMLSFYADMGVITQEQAQAIRDGNKAYVPFFRVRHQVDQEANTRGTGKKVGKQLHGGEQNTGEIIENILDGLHANIQAALTSRARARLFEDIKHSQEGSEFAVEIPTDSKRIKLAHEQMVNRMAEVLVAAGRGVNIASSGTIIGNHLDPHPIDLTDIDNAIAHYPELAAFWQHGMTPETNETGVESVIIKDKMRHFEVNSRLLMEMLTAPRAAPALIRGARVPKRVLTQAITGTIQFMFPNIVRDTMAAGGLSQSGSRPFIESARGLKAYIANDSRFKAFRANGGLFSGRITTPLEGLPGADQRRVKAQVGMSPKNGWDYVGKALAGYQTIISSTEQGTRVGEFIRATEKGVNPLEAAFRGRMVSGDFAQMGRNEVWSWLMQVTPFANAGIRGTETLIQNMFEGKDGKVRISGSSAVKFAKMALTRFGFAMTAATVLLWVLNHDDERYKRLTVDEKSRYWHIFLPGGQHVTIPKPYGVGFIFADIPEMALDYMADKDGPQLAKQLGFSLMQHFWFMDYPALLQPFIEEMQNRKFTGAPIVPPNLAALTGDDLQYQYTDTTPLIYRELGKATAGNANISPLIAEHFTKGFLGYVEAYMVDATNWALWDEKKWGPQPFAGSVLGYFTHQFDGNKPPYRTKWTEGYYDLRSRAMSKAQAYASLFKMAGHDESPLTTFTQSEVNLALRALSTRFRKVDKSMSGGNAYLDGIKFDPNLTRKEKEDKIDAYYEERDKVLGTTYREIDALVTKLESGIK